MNRETTLLNKNLNRKLFDDDLADEMLIQEKACMMDESDMIFDKDLLSGKYMIELEGGYEDDYVCLDHFLASQMVSFFHE